MSNYPHTFTVGETFGGVKVEITISTVEFFVATEQNIVVDGAQFVHPAGELGPRVRASLSRQLSGLKALAVAVAGDVFDERKLLEKEKVTLDRANAVQAAKDETAKQLGDMLENVKKNNAEDFQKAQDVFTASLENLRLERDEAVAALFAKNKRSTAAKAGHMRKASKAGRK